MLRPDRSQTPPGLLSVVFCDFGCGTLSTQVYPGPLVVYPGARSTGSRNSPVSSASDSGTPSPDSPSATPICTWKRRDLRTHGVTHAVLSTHGRKLPALPSPSPPLWKLGSPTPPHLLGSYAPPSSPRCAVVPILRVPTHLFFFFFWWCLGGGYGDALIFFPGGAASASFFLGR